ncbi:ligand-binding sensor domain-containing diguanylate cyclase [Alteromonas flava]|uniref:ligand-binding sensor domain-containing diguanylate cyclase n=1 Tax=Alteromonas flava TaxID=2048003 RepID=UPI000C289B08|nr:ligand-binding sensor domain-containing diguanylate cyclase [Alteromonas flava]
MRRPPHFLHYFCCVIACLFSPLTTATQQFFEHPVYYSPLQNLVGVDGDIVAIAEDRQGFIWFVSGNGLWRWDSHILVRATFADVSTGGVSPDIQTLATDSTGTIWVGTSRGLYTLNTDSRQLNAVENAEVATLSVQEVSVSSLTDSAVFFASDRNLFRFNTATNMLESLILPYDARIHALLIHGNKLWIGTGRGLLFMEVGKTDIQPAPVAEFPENTRVSALTITPNGQLFVGTANKGLFTPQGEQGFVSITLLNNEPNPWIYSLTAVNDTALLLGTFGKGLLELNLATNEVQNSRANPLHPSGLANDNVWALLTDSRGIVWMGVNTDLQFYDIGNQAVKRILGNLQSGKGLIQRSVHSVREVADDLIVGTGSQGLEKLDPETGQSEIFWTGDADPVETLFATKNGKLFASSNFSSVLVDPKSGDAQPIELPGRPVAKYSSAYAQTGAIEWVGGTDGLWAYDRTNQRAQNVFADAEHDRRVASLLATPSQLWIGTWRGLYVIAEPASEAPEVKPAPEATELLQEQFIAMLYRDSRAQIWAATSNAGLFVYSEGAGWRQINISPEQPGGRVEAIAGEANGRVFVSTSKSIVAVDIVTLGIHAVVNESIAINRPFRRGAATQLPNEVMVFGGSNGLTLIDTTKIKSDPINTSLLLTNVSVTTSEDRILSPSLTAKQLKFPALNKRFSFEFTVLDYIGSNNVLYRYRLKEHDDSWSYTDSDHRIATFTQLSPGNYTLQIEYSYDGETWQANAFSRNILIPPAWYQTWFANLMFGLLLGFVLYSVHKLRVRKLRRQQSVLEDRVSARTAELVAANKTLNQQAEALREASMTDALTGLHNRRYLAQNIERDMAKLNRYYAECEKSAIPPDYANDVIFFLIDIDHFKAINDTYGHQVGDQVLVETSRRLQQVFREIDYLIRWGGEEFLVVVHNTPRQEGEVLAERVMDAIGGNHYHIKDDETKQVTCSIGFTAYPLSMAKVNALSWEATIGIADMALYAAKNNNRDTWIGITEINHTPVEEAITKIERDTAFAFEYANVSARRGKNKSTSNSQ